MRRGTFFWNNDKCLVINGKIGTWRKYWGKAGGEKGWCNNCLKNSNSLNYPLKYDAFGHQTFDWKCGKLNIRKRIGYEER